MGGMSCAAAESHSTCRDKLLDPLLTREDSEPVYYGNVPIRNLNGLLSAMVSWRSTRSRSGRCMENSNEQWQGRPGTPGLGLAGRQGHPHI